MRAAVLHGVRDLRIEERPIPSYAGDEVLLRVLSVTICGSDVHYYTDGAIGTQQVSAPVVLGHEFAAEVVAVGAQVRGLRTGQTVAVEPGVSCGECEQCRRGYPNLCPYVRFCATPPIDGALREYMPYAPHALFPLPEGLSAEDGAMLEPLCIAIRALDFGKLRIGETAAVIGCGGIGLLIVQLLRAAGAGEIYVSEPVGYRAQTALGCGATAVLGPEDPAADLLARTSGRGVDVAWEAATSVRTQRLATELARLGGRVVLVGIPPEDEFALAASPIRRKGLTITSVRRAANVYPRAITLAEKGMVDLRSLVTHRLPLADAARAFELMASHEDGVIRAAIAVQE